MLNATQATEATQIATLVSELTSANPVKRMAARHALVQIGGPEITSQLASKLSDVDKQIRWEAAKTISEMCDPSSAPILVKTLDDEDADVRWIAAEGLIELGMVGLKALLHRMLKHSQSVVFCRTAHHILSELAIRGFNGYTAPVIAALEQPEPASLAPTAAYDALLALGEI